MKIITTPFNITASEYLNIMFKMFVKRWWWAFLAITLGIFSLSVFNISFIFVGLMFIFIIIPMIMSFLYIYYGLLPESRFSILEKRAEMSDNAITLHFEDKQQVIPLSNFERYEPQSKWILLHFKHHRYCFFAIPYTAFNSTNDIRQAARLLIKING